MAGSNAAPRGAPTSLGGLPVISQPGENEHSDRPVRCERHQVQVDKDYVDYCREAQPRVNELLTVFHTCPPSWGLSTSRSHTLCPHAHSVLLLPLLSTWSLCPRPQPSISSLSLGTCFRSGKTDVFLSSCGPCSKPSTPQDLLQHCSGLCSMSGSQRWGHIDPSTRGWESWDNRARSSFPPTHIFFSRSSL